MEMSFIRAPFIRGLADAPLRREWFANARRDA
jgi:hypothetical protein